MSEKYLILTVGGACAPIVNAIEEDRPDFVYFICSEGPNGSRRVVDGAGTPCAESKSDRKLPSIVAQTKLPPEKYRIFGVENPDDLGACYELCMQVEEDIQRKTEESRHRVEVVANYTSGTKTMSSALVLCALQRGWKLECNVGPRQDLVKVHVGDVPVRVDPGAVVLDQHLGTLKSLLKTYQYAEAAELLTRLLRQGQIPRDRQQHMIACRNLCQAFNTWDRFEHAEARNLLEPYGRYCSRHLVFIKRLLGETKPHTGYEKVEDLLYNAQRRAAQKRFDDAVARLYRAVEMLAQGRLDRGYGIDTSQVDVHKIPESSRREYVNAKAPDGKIKIGLHQAYQLLRDLRDPLGSLFSEQQNQLGNALAKRNASILAHGVLPIGEGIYEEVAGVLMGFLIKGLDLVGHKTQLDLQMPTTLDCLD